MIKKTAITILAFVLMNFFVALAGFIVDGIPGAIAAIKGTYFVISVIMAALMAFIFAGLISKAKHKEPKKPTPDKVLNDIAAINPKGE